MKRWFGLLLCLNVLQAYSWNSTGHQLIARLALMQLSSSEISTLNAYNQAYHVGFQPQHLVQAAAWLDWVRCRQKQCRDFKHYHYIDYPYSLDGTPSMPPHSVNAVMAIRQAQRVLNNPDARSAEKGLALRILLHVVGDIHQPMHAVSLYSQQFPEGDRGGNDYLLGPNRVGKNLHAYWDRGGGYLVRKTFHHRKGTYQQLQRLQKRYPCRLQEMEIDPNIWAKESYELARHDAYSVGYKHPPSRAYQKKVTQITMQRMSLAACRLAAMLVQARVGMS